MEIETAYRRMNYRNNKNDLKNKPNNNLIFKNYIENTFLNLANKYSSEQFKNKIYINPNILSSDRININSMNLKKEKEFLFDLNKKENDYQRKKEKEQYRKDLLKQIEENERRKKEKKRKLEEEDKINEIKNMNYLMYKQKQEEEFEKIKKMNNNKRIKSQFNNNSQEYNITYYSKKGNDLEEKKEKEEKEEKEENKEEKDIKKQERKEGKKEEITNNYNKIVRTNYFNMFEEKEELKNYINNQFNDFLYILDDETENEKNKKIFENINEYELFEKNNKIQNENNRYIINKDKIHRNVDKIYNMNYNNKIKDVNEMIKSYRYAISPKIYFNHEIDTLLNSYSNMIIHKPNKENNYINNKINKLSNDIKFHEKLENQKKDIEKEKENEKSIEEKIKSNIPFKESKVDFDDDILNNKINQNEISNEIIDGRKNEEDLRYDNYLVF